MNGFKIPAQSGFENMMNKGMSFLSAMGQQQQQQQQSQSQGQDQTDPRCQFFKNFMQGNCKQWGQQQQQKPEKPQEKQKWEHKMEEAKDYKMEEAVNEESVLENAQYLAQYGFEFTKCY